MLRAAATLNPIFYRQTIRVIKENGDIISKKVTLNDFIKTCIDLHNEYNFSEIQLFGPRDYCSKIKQQLEKNNIKVLII